jgi:hypothetical protein
MDRLRIWKPSIHMPRRYSRISLEVTRIWAERVREIKNEDVRAEGLVVPVDMTLLEGFGCLWNHINGGTAYAWEYNPWVWVVEFRRVK